ncbi:ATP synthase subunit s, mitochondrial isoform X1 [Dendrobates tinctorius]|uniref:ATP synthase subunit s, mitochondrial isoform X1 n=2 Tax=Dendrobates tinctorius TaxID=92724 RepID=UPI003CCA137C
MRISTKMFLQIVRPSLRNKKRIPSPSGCRYFWGWLNAVFNRVDYERIKEAGPDRAASEWLLRCGAKVRYKGFEKWQQDYNGLPTGPLGKYKIQGIDATDSCIMYRGFDYLEGLEHLEEVKLSKCIYIEDACLERISKIENLQKSLQRLEIITCGNVSDRGVISLHSLRSLQYLYLCDLPAIKQRDLTVERLQKSNALLHIKVDLIYHG